MRDWRARIGVLFPGNSIVDRELWQLVPDGVTVHVNRLGSLETLTEPYSVAVALRRSQSRELEDATENLRIVEPSCVTYACTSGSFVAGVGHDQTIIDRLAPIARVPVSTTSTAVVRALRALGVGRVAVGVPYLGELGERLQVFLEGSGFKVVNMSALDLPHGFATVPAAETYRLGRRADTTDAEAVFIACTALHTLEVLEPLEDDLDKPVVTANQATMWDALRLAGVSTRRLDGRGTLYRRG
jgi:maleate isomerase